jgi:hypothetical protein
VAIRRAHKDKRSWRQFARIVALFLVPLDVIAYVFAVLDGTYHLWVPFIFLCALTGLLGRLAFLKPVGQPDTVQKLGISEPVYKTDTETRLCFAKLALVHALLVNRAASESFVQTKVLPEGVEIITRRAHLDVLRKYGVYDRLGSKERDLFLLPDGHWPQQTINDAPMLLEPIRLFRWLLRVDDYLPTIGSNLTVDYRMANAIVKNPEIVFRGAKMVSDGDLETALSAAELYFFRCWSEGVARGYSEFNDEEYRERAIEFAAELNNLEHADLLLGVNIVSKASDSDVKLATKLSFLRAQVLGKIQQQMRGELLPSDLLEVFYLQ